MIDSNYYNYLSISVGVWYWRKYLNILMGNTTETTSVGATLAIILLYVLLFYDIWLLINHFLKKDAPQVKAHPKMINEMPVGLARGQNNESLEPIVVDTVSKKVVARLVEQASLRNRKMSSKLMLKRPR